MQANPDRRKGKKDVLYENIMVEVLSSQNLKQAYRTVKRNKGAAGVDGMTTVQLGAHLRQHWPSIREKVAKGCYRPSPVKSVRIPKAGGGTRQLGIPTVLDRFIQQALSQSLTEIFDPQMSQHSYGYRPGRSAHDAIKAAQAYVQEGKDWVVDIDISAFFDHVNHDILMHRLSQNIRDKAVLRLIGEYLRADMLDGGQRVKRKTGTPQGGPLSPLLANIYLDKLDKELESRGLYFCRYADDLNIYVSSERSAQRVLESVSQWIEKNLKLTVNQNKSGSGRPWDRKFLGFKIQENGEIGIAKQSLEKYKDKVRERWDAKQSLTSKELVKQWRMFMLGWWAYFGIAKTKLTKLSAWTRRHIRKCFWQRWHSRKGRIRNLRLLGVSDEQLRRTEFYASAWKASKHPSMHKALSNKMLQRYGLITPDVLAVR